MVGSNFFFFSKTVWIFFYEKWRMGKEAVKGAIFHYLPPACIYFQLILLANLYNNEKKTHRIYIYCCWWSIVASANKIIYRAAPIKPNEKIYIYTVYIFKRGKQKINIYICYTRHEEWEQRMKMRKTCWNSNKNRLPVVPWASLCVLQASAIIWRRSSCRAQKDLGTAYHANSAQHFSRFYF